MEFNNGRVILPSVELVFLECRCGEYKRVTTPDGITVSIRVQSVCVCVCVVCAVIHCDRINGITVNEDFMRNEAEDGWDIADTRFHDKCLLSNSTHMAHLSHFRNKLALLFFPLSPPPPSHTLVPLFFSCYFFFLPWVPPAIPSSTSLSFPLSLSLARCPARSLGSAAKQRAFENFNHFPANGVETTCPPTVWLSLLLVLME